MSLDAATPVEVIVPIHNAADLVESCLDALLRHLPDFASVQLIDDASEDPRIGRILEAHPIKDHHAVRSHRNPRNLGFVRTVNEAVARTRVDVVLLNSDTQVTTDWLPRMRRCAYSGDDVASVTPWSNNAEICSLPGLCQPVSPPRQPDALATALATIAPVYPALPTAIGFCMYLRRSAWRAIGDFDAATFGRGYGEENDWCLRASAHGFRHLLCDNAYVVHIGGASFAGTGHRPGGEQLTRLLARYPYYNALIADFIQTDPLARHRRALLADSRLSALLQP